MHIVMLKVAFWCGALAAAASFWGLLLSGGLRVFIWTLIGAFALMLFCGFHLSKEYRG